MQAASRGAHAVRIAGGCSRRRGFASQGRYQGRLNGHDPQACGNETMMRGILRPPRARITTRCRDGDIVSAR